MQASCVDNFVERLFETAPDRNDHMRKNPVTGGYFVSGLDPIDPQKEVAQRAQTAKWLFEMIKPADAPELPVDDRVRSETEFESPLHWLVAKYSASLTHNGYDFRKHPVFEDYARGVMACPLAPNFIKKHSDLLKRFPPKQLKGLGRGMVWQPARRSRKRL